MKVDSVRTVLFSAHVRVFLVEYDIDGIAVFRPGLSPLSLEFKIPNLRLARERKGRLLKEIFDST